MKPRVISYCRSMLLVLATAFLMSMATAFAQDSGNQTSSYAQAEISRNYEMFMARMDAGEPEMDRNHRDLLSELLQSVSSNQNEHPENETPCVTNECTLAAAR